MRSNLGKWNDAFSILPRFCIVEIIEIPEHLLTFIGTQAHPEFKSRPNKPHPLFKGFLAASLAHQK